MTKVSEDLERTKQVMSELLRQSPKTHDEMKLGKAQGKKAASPKPKARKSKK